MTVVKSITVMVDKQLNPQIISLTFEGMKGSPWAVLEAGLVVAEGIVISFRIVFITSQPTSSSPPKITHLARSTKFFMAFLASQET